jgi:hypothetical protein
MKIDNTKLLKFIEAINSNLLGLIVKLIALSKAIAARSPIEAQRYPEILRHLNNSIQGQLMQLHLEFEQNLNNSKAIHSPTTKNS